MVIKPVIASILAALVLAPDAGAGEVEPVRIGKAEVVYDYEISESGLATLTLNAVVDETNDSLRGLKNTDRRRLSKLGQLIYQCKLMLYKPAGRGASSAANDHLLIARNYSLYTGINLTLAADERLGLRVQALRRVDEASLFSTALGSGEAQSRLWETPGRQGAADLRQIDVNLLQESDVIETSESIEIALRFPVFQLEKPVREWTYNFDVRDFRLAVRHVDENCSPARLESLTDGSS